MFLYGEKRLSKLMHWFSAVMVFVGSWISGFFIIVTDAWMQHPTGYTLGPKGEVILMGFWAFILNPWGLWQYLHNMIATVVTAGFAMAAIGAYYLLSGKHLVYGKTFVRIGVIAGTVALLLLLFPTGDQQGKMVLEHQPATLAAMEGLFDTEHGAPLAILGQPDMEKMKLDNPFVVPKALSFLTYQSWGAEVRGLKDFPRDSWPDNVPLLYFAYHIMVGLGTLMLALMGISLLLLRGGKLYSARPVLWMLMLALPFPYIATTAGWMTAEIGRQPWLVYGIMRTAQGSSPQVSAGNGLFTLLGFMGLYMVLGVVFLFLIMREVEHGPEAEA